MSAVRHLVLSQCTHVTDGQTDGQTDRITTPKTALAYARAVKTTEGLAAFGAAVDFYNLLPSLLPFTLPFSASFSLPLAHFPALMIRTTFHGLSGLF